MKDFEVLNAADIENIRTLAPSGAILPPGKYTSGATFKSFTVDQSYYLQDLRNRLDQLGVKFAKREINCISELCNEGFHVVVNCCGIVGSVVAEDPILCYPIRGQVIRVR